MRNATEMRRPWAEALAFLMVSMAAGCGEARPPAPSVPVVAAKAENAVAGDGRLPPAKQVHVKTPDGLSIAVQEWGNPKGPEVLFIHGLSQSHLSWAPQIESSLAKDFRLVTYDLRGHGVSDKPIETKYYEEARRWGDELRAVIEGAGLRRPVVVGWSLGGVVILDYLRAYGDAGLGGIVFVDAVTRFDRALLGEMPPLWSEDLSTRLGAMRQFLRDCFVVPPPPAEFETMLMYNAMVPVEVQGAVGRIPLDGADESLRALLVPALVIHGAEDRHAKVAMATRTASLVRGARLSVYEGVGHAPFYEARERFNAELAGFLREVNGGREGVGKK
ncbi:alpha/beta fold hydrolase [Polyangium jinanense]|uniref:Alpha/beta hydrolase n=1 Tax=Polyangium jinanense TaxID=2829994 RepID=A0A9X3X7C7_9BACT|nr:alpha/beta hydrolase [Polyangium jinanense]MDC3960427.1 alpha/beta hydrolase [Polyangium jinanense]MDC3985329.1 alpha/beta hydrolase [Polyangium jinanense]